MPDELLGASELRAIAARWGIRPTKQWGQNFVVDANTVRRIVRLAGTEPGDEVLEVGPGLGSLTLGLLAIGAHVTAVEVDPVLASALPDTVQRMHPDWAERLTVIEGDALRVGSLPSQPIALVANLPYNVAVPVVLHLLATLPSLRSGLVMVQAEVADRLVAAPGSRTYGVPSAKFAWFAHGERAGSVPASVFWPVPRVESGLVSFQRHEPPATLASRAEVFAVVDAAFAQRRKTLRAALAGWAGSAAAAEEILLRAGVDPSARGESLDIAAFARIAAARMIA
ncbi:MAG: 16S rRNA (adenine(1518)-N(6)/adenine(1519)-N(6))-dimethyltransferase RsmA [Candidatus Nanopelagicales bacterium]